MRVRALVLGFLLAALSARAATVRVVRFDAKLASGEHSALCVVPREVQGSAAARYICYFVIPGKGKIRDNTRAGGSPQPVEQSDPSFTTWLGARLPAGNECVLSAIANGPDFPAKNALEVLCPDLQYETGVAPAGTSETFMGNVHKAVDATLPKNVAAAAPAAAAPAPAAAPPTTTTATDTEAPVETTTTKIDDAPGAGGEWDRDTDTDTKPLSTETQGPPAPVVEEPMFSFDWRTALLIFIAVLMTFVAVERVIALAPRPAQVTNAQTPESAAAQRDALEAARRSTDDLQETLSGIDRDLGLGKDEDRATRIGSLVRYEQELLRLAGGATSAPAAIVEIEQWLKERKEIEELLGTNGKIVDSVREHVQLVDSCSGPFWSREKTAVGVAVIVKEIERDVHRLYASINQSGESEPDARTALKTIQQALDKLREQQKKIDSQQRTLGAVAGFIASQWPDAVPDDLDATVATLAQRMRDARARATSIEHAAGRGADAVITELAALVESERRVAHDAHEILARLRDYLALPAGDGESLRKIIVAELGTPRRILRLVLAAALPAIRATLDRLTGEEEARVVRMLALSELHTQLTAFLGRLSTYDGAQLWEKGLQAGFSQQWLHYLFRAEAVLRTYFMASSLAELAEMLMVIAWAFRHAIATASGYQVDRIQLLAELPASMDQAHVNPRELQSCPDIRSRVKAALKAHRDGDFTIDVDTIGLRNGTHVLWRSGLVVANRHDWEG